MVRVRISEGEKILLEKSFEKKHSKIDFPIIDNAVHLENDVKRNLEIIIENISDYFISDGLKSDDEPNALGFELENLKTKFIRELVTINNNIRPSKKNIFHKK